MKVLFLQFVVIGIQTWSAYYVWLIALKFFFNASFAKIVKSTPVPIVIAGGPKAKTDLDILQMTEDVMAAGAKGITYGRNIFAHKTPEKMVEALAEIIFSEGTAKEALKKIE